MTAPSTANTVSTVPVPGTPPFREVTPTPIAPRRPMAKITFTERATIGIGRIYRRVRRGCLRRDLNRIRHEGCLDEYRVMMQLNKIAWDVCNVERVTAGRIISIEPVLVAYVSASLAAADPALEKGYEEYSKVSEPEKFPEDCVEAPANPFEERIVIDLTGDD
ncbi:hypothetical protein EDC01DRAFT_629246 [Geopyxis carbonaria]|nr:hypothetical protein EDC01DRAFT_629246 [Geopyxis carbonaria]